MYRLSSTAAIRMGAAIIDDGPYEVRIACGRLRSSKQGAWLGFAGDQRVEFGGDIRRQRGARQVTSEPLRGAIAGALENGCQLSQYQRLSPQDESDIDGDSQGYSSEEFHERVMDSCAVEKVSPSAASCGHHETDPQGGPQGAQKRPARELNQAEGNEKRRHHE